MGKSKKLIKNLNNVLLSDGLKTNGIVDRFKIESYTNPPNVVIQLNDVEGTTGKALVDVLTAMLKHADHLSRK